MSYSGVRAAQFGELGNCPLLTNGEPKSEEVSQKLQLPSLGRDSLLLFPAE